MAITIDRATSADGAEILDLLTRSALPPDGVLDHLETAFVARDNGRIVASAVLEIYKDGALLRSVAVDSAFRGRGVGHQLTKSALDLSATLGLPAVYLLTTTAEGFFPKFQFAPIERAQVP